jgi:hypothetical protein
MTGHISEVPCFKQVFGEAATAFGNSQTVPQGMQYNIVDRPLTLFGEQLDALSHQSIDVTDHDIRHMAPLRAT